MCSNLFILLAISCVASSDRAVEVHVSGVSPRYQNLEFKDAGSKNKIFSLSEAATGGDNVRLKDGKINEKGLKLTFVASSAAVLKPPVQEDILIEPMNPCKADKICFAKNPGSKTMLLNVLAVGDAQYELKCTDGANMTITFTLTFNEKSKCGSIAVSKEGIIQESELPISIEPSTCVIEKVEGIQGIQLANVENCSAVTQNCFENIEVASRNTVDVHVTDVSPEYVKLEFTDSGSEKQIFSLSADDTSNTNVKVEEGKIEVQDLDIGFSAMSAVILEVLEHESITIEQVHGCSAGTICFQVDQEEPVMTLHASGVGSKQETMVCSSGNQTQLFTLDHTGTCPTGHIAVSSFGVINTERIEIPFVPTACVIEKVVKLSEKKLVMKSPCVKGEPGCFENKEIASKKAVKIYVSEVHSRHTKLEFQGTEGEKRAFYISANDTSEGNIKVDKGTIEVEVLDIGFVASSVNILDVPDQDEITINPDINCNTQKSCFKINPEKYTLHVSGVASEHDILTCRRADKTQNFNLVVGENSGDTTIAVSTAGVINESELLISFEPMQCVIAESTPLEAILLKQKNDCSDLHANCFKNTAGFDNSVKFGLLTSCLMLGKML